MPGTASVTMPGTLNVRRNDTRKSKPEAETQRIGVYTNAWFRSQMMDMLLTCLSEEAIDLPSPYLIDQLETLERRPGLRKIEAQYGYKDDRMMAIGIPLFSLHQNKPPSKQYARQRVEYASVIDDGIQDYAVWTPPEAALSTGFQPRQEVTFSRRGRVNGLARYVNRSLPKGFR